MLKRSGRPVQTQHVVAHIVSSQNILEILNRFWARLSILIKYSQMYTNNDIGASNLMSARRVPPLPNKNSQAPNVALSRQMQKSNFAQHQPLTFTKKTSQVSFNNDMERRRTMENNSRPSAELVESMANIQLQNQRVSNYRSNTCAEVNIANDLLQIIKDQNRNLKEQNNFLLSKIRQLTQNEKGLKQALIRYELIVNQLGQENHELKVQNRELSEIANRQVNQFGNKLAELMTDTETQSQGAFKSNETEPTFQHFQTTGNPSQFYNLLNTNQFSSTPGTSSAQCSLPPAPPKHLHTKADSSTQPNDSLMDELNNQFDALLYSCSVQKNLENRKQIRKKLLELTNKMRQLRK